MNAGPQDPILLQRELWSSWAGVLRSYAAVHSLGQAQHAVVEVSADTIVLRYGTRSLRFWHNSMEDADGRTSPFNLSVNGDAHVDGTEEPMDLAAERLTREIIVL